MIEVMDLPKPGTSFWKNGKEYVVLEWEQKLHGWKAKLVAHEVGCKKHPREDWCLGMDPFAWQGQVEKGEISFEPRKHQDDSSGSPGSGGSPEGEAPAVQVFEGT